MTKYIFLFIFLLLPLTLQATPLLSHQGRMLQSDSSPLTGVETVTFILYTQETDGSALWQEEIDISFDNGFYSVLLGETNTLSQDIFENDDLWLAIRLDGQVEFNQRQQLTSVPFAFRAAKTDSVTGSVHATGDLIVDGQVVIDSSGTWQGEPISYLDLADPPDLSDYATNTELSTSDGDGPNEGSNLVSWNNLVDVPHGFADGEDGGGLVGTGETNQLAKFSDTDQLSGIPLYEVSGQLGIGTETPNEMLTVDGSLSLQTQSESPSSTEEYGKLYVKTSGAGQDENTVLLVHSDTTNGSTDFIDSSNQSHSISPSGNSIHSSSQTKFGDTAIYFDGNEDFLVIPSHDDWSFGSGDFTIDFWTYPTGHGDRNWGGFLTTADVRSPRSGWIVRYYTDTRKLLLHEATGDHNYYTTNVIPFNQWTHVAVVRSGNTLYFFLNGTQDSTHTINHAMDASPLGLMIGESWFHYDYHELAGYMDEVRISKGIARWTSDFDPSAQPYSHGEGLFFTDSLGNEYKVLLEQQ